MLANQAMVRNGDGRPRNEHGSEETTRSCAPKKKTSRRRRTPAERAKEKNDAVFWAFVEAEMKTDAAWAKIDKLAAATEPHDEEVEEFEESDAAPEEDGAEWHAAFLEWQVAVEEGETTLAFEEWACDGHDHPLV